MPTDTTAPRTASQTEPKLDLRVADAANDFLSTTQSLTPDQVRILNQLLSPLDRATTPLRMGLFASKQADRTALLEYMVRPVTSRKVRTPEHRKVVGLRVDATSVPEGMQPWHFLVLNVIELLTECALPTERITLSELRNEINRLISQYRRDPDAARQPAITFARRFQTAFPKLVLNTISLANSVLLIVLDGVDNVDPGDALQWLEAAQYFCNAASCAILVSASEPTLIAKLNLSEENANGSEVLRSWLTRRVDYVTGSAADQPSTPVVRNAALTPVSREKAAVVVPHIEVPTAAANIIRDALQPDVRAIVNTTSHWRAVMHAVLRRTEEGLGSSISGALIAKLVTLRAVAPKLFDAARYDAKMLLALERSSHGDSSADVYEEWTSQVSQHPRLVGLLAAEPAFAGMDLRVLATALRLSNVNDDEVAQQEAADARHGRLSASPRLGSANAAAHSFWEAMLNVEGRFLLSPSLVATAGAGAAVFLLDRLVKLLLQAYLQTPDMELFGGLIKPELLPTNAVTGSIWGGGLAVGTELFGLALAILITLFWGGMRTQAKHSISLGLIIGALASNLFDRLAYGSVLNYIHLANLPVFNLSHVALLVGALLLAFSLLRGPRPTTRTVDQTQAGAN